MGIGASVNTQTALSPYEAVFGRVMPLGTPIASTEDCTLQGSAKEYLKFVQQRLQELHKGVRDNIEDAKADAKTFYDKANNAQVSKFRVGDEVLLEDTRPNTRQGRILSHRRFDKGPYFITEEISNNQCGIAYRLVHVGTGKAHRGLVNGDRLKKYHKDRSGLVSPQDVPLNAQPVYQEAKRIIKQAGSGMYLVEFVSGEKLWTSDVSPLILKEWRLQQDRNRLQRRLKRQRLVR